MEFNKRWFGVGFKGLFGSWLTCFCLNTNAQVHLPKTELIILPKVSYTTLHYDPEYTSQQGALVFSPSKTVPTQLINQQGQWVNVQGKPLRFGMDLGIKRTRSTGQAWSLLVGADWGRQLYGSWLSQPYTFGGYTIVGWYPYLSYWQLNGAISYYFREQALGPLTGNLFLRLTAHKTGRLYSIIPGKTLSDAYPTEFIQNGQGDQIDLKEFRALTSLIEPEIGLKLDLLELSVSASVPIQASFTESHVFTLNNQVINQNEVRYRLGGIYLNARLSLTVVRFASHQRTHSKSTASTPLPAKAPIPTTRDQTIQLNNVYFEASSAVLLPSSNAQLNELINQMRQQPNLRIRLEGHTDIIGDVELNQKLSEERVKAIQVFMVSSGIEQQRIALRGYGDKRPLRRDCQPPIGCPENRRVELVVTDF